MKKGKLMKAFFVLTLIMFMMSNTLLVSADDSLNDTIVEAGNIINSESQYTIDEEDLVVIDETIDIISIYENQKTQNEIESYALTFMQNSQPEHDIRLLFSCPLYGLDNTVTGYYVTFARDGNPEGYVLISFLHVGSPIVDLSFDGLGIFDNIESLQYSILNEKIYYLAPDEFYQICSEDSHTVYKSLFEEKTIGEETAVGIYYNSLLSLNENISQMENSITGDIWDGFIDWSDVALDGTTDYKIPKFGSGSSYWIQPDFGTGSICCPTALTNVLWYWGWMYNDSIYNHVQSRINLTGNVRNDATTLFWELFLALDTNINGHNSFFNVPGALETFFESPNNNGVWAYRYISGFDSLYSTITENCPILTHISKDGVGHAIFTLGRIKDTGGNKYLIVMDGTHRYGRIINSTYYGDMSGYKIFLYQ